MKIAFLPRTKLGYWAVGLQMFFLSGTASSILLVNGLDLLSYDDRWWDITVPIIFFASVSSLVLSIIAIRKHKDFSTLIYISAGTGLLVVLFIFLHSLFISD